MRLWMSRKRAVSIASAPPSLMGHGTAVMGHFTIVCRIPAGAQSWSSGRTVIQ